MTTRRISADEARRLWGDEMFGGARFEHRYPPSRTITTTLDGETVEVAHVAPTSPGTERAIIHLLTAAPDLTATVIAQAEEIARLREVIEGRTTTLGVPEILHHIKSGGGWMVTLPERHGVRGEAMTRYTDNPAEATKLLWFRGARWVAVRDGQPCEPAKVNDGERQR